jgi:hypothetical protein
MEHPYRVHSSIGFGFLQLLMLSSLAYPTPPPPLYHNIALTRMMGTVYFTLFQDKPIYLKLECLTIILEVIRDALYIKYIIQDYTYLFGVFDIVGNLLFCVVVGLSIENGENRWSIISESFEGIRKTCFRCWFGGGPSPNDGKLAQASSVGDRGRGGAVSGVGHEAPRELDARGHLYKSLSTNENGTEAPVYTFGSHQAFKPSFYSSSWGREYINAKVEREFDRIDMACGSGGDEIGMISRTDGSTQYIRFDDAEAAAGANNYANIFVSPYFAKDGTPITSFSGWTKVDSIGVCLFIYNLIQFIYQLLMYSSIVGSCREYHTSAAENGILSQWLC